MAKIFISYRRDGSGGWAGRLDDWLSRHFGRDNVFMDINTIEPGLDFVEVIEQAVGSCDALIALIGKQWLTITDEAGLRRLDNLEDFVRLEIAAALARNIRVIPVLVEGALMPRSTDLPDVLKLLARHNAHEIRDRRFPYDVEVNGPFERLYPHIAQWVQAHGYIEIGYDDYSRSFIRALDIGGMIWQGLEHYATLDEALQALEYALAEWMQAQGVE